MTKAIKIAVDAMGGDGSPKKIIDGIVHHNKQSNNRVLYQIFGDKNTIEPLVKSKSIDQDAIEIIHT